MVDLQCAVVSVWHEDFQAVSGVKAVQVVGRLEEVEVHCLDVLFSGYVQKVLDLYRHWLRELEVRLQSWTTGDTGLSPRGRREVRGVQMETPILMAMTSSFGMAPWGMVRMHPSRLHIPPVSSNVAIVWSMYRQSEKEGHFSISLVFSWTIRSGYVTSSVLSQD